MSLKKAGDAAKNVADRVEKKVGEKVAEYAAKYGQGSPTPMRPAPSTGGGGGGNEAKAGASDALEKMVASITNRGQKADQQQRENFEQKNNKAPTSEKENKDTPKLGV